MEAGNRGLDLERELTCSICAEVLYAPQTLLDCLHTFCGSCLKEWFRWQYSSWRNAPDSLPSDANPFTCPSCRAQVRDTKHNSSVTTLLEMFLTANPEKCRRAEELEELKKIYCRGDKVLPKLNSGEREKIRERQAEDSDRTLIEEVREMSLREVTAEHSDGRLRDPRRGNENSSAASSLRNRDITSESRRAEERSRARRRRREDYQSRNSRERSFQSNEAPQNRRHGRSHDGGSNERENHNNLADHQIEHQSSLRSLASSIDIGSQEMEEEILYQIREEGLLDGIDLENIDVSQEDQISDWLVEAFRRRQNERARREPTGRNRSIQTRQRNRSSSESAHISRVEISQNSSATQSSDNVRSTNSLNHASIQNRPPQSQSALQTTRLRGSYRDDDRPSNQRTTNRNRSTTELISRTRTKTRPATRSASNLRDRSQSLLSPSNWSVAQSSRSTNDLTTTQSMEPTMSLGSRQTAMRPIWSSQGSLSTRMDSSQTITEQNDDETPGTRNSSSLPDPTTTSLENLSSPTEVSERDNVLSSGPGASPLLQSPCPMTRRNRSSFFTEPFINCLRCGKNHIEYEWHYNCNICSEGHYNICLSCYRSGYGCLYWLGFGLSAWKKWEILNQSTDAYIEKPHTLTPSCYLPPKAIPGGADGRRTLTTDDPRNRLQSGTFCASCYAWTNHCYWRCDVCNDGDWGFCDSCVNQGRCCTHPLLPLTYQPTDANSSQIPLAHDQIIPVNAQILTGSNVIEMGDYKPLTFSTRCDICRNPIQPSQSRYHCFCCSGKGPNTLPGSYDVCTSCYPKFVRSRRISIENGSSGWRRCLEGHRMIVVRFQEKYGGQHRIVINDLVGGKCLRQKACTGNEYGNLDLQLWSWGDGFHARGDNSHVKLVMTDVKKSAPNTYHSFALERGFPPDGGVGIKCIAIWGWYPSNDIDDELLFPRGAEIRECKDVNGDWFYGSYMGREGLFPAKYVRIMGTESAT